MPCHRAGGSTVVSSELVWKSTWLGKPGSSFPSQCLGRVRILQSGRWLAQPVFLPTTAPSFLLIVLGSSCTLTPVLSCLSHGISFAMLSYPLCPRHPLGSHHHPFCILLLPLRLLAPPPLTVLSAPFHRVPICSLCLCVLVSRRPASAILPICPQLC